MSLQPEPYSYNDHDASCEWIKSERYQKKVKEDAKRREQNNPMKTCVLKYDHFENIHRLDAKLPVQEGAPNWRQVKSLKRGLKEGL